MILGDFKFSLKTLSPNSLSRTTEYKWPDTERVGDLPFVQNLGVAKDQIEIEGVFYPKLNAGCQYNSLQKLAVDTVKNEVMHQLGLREFFESGGSYGSINDIRNSNLCKTANNLINDSGEILGKFVITSIKETQSFFDKNGQAQKIEFTLSLKRTPEVTNAFVGMTGSTIIDTLTNLARSYLRW